MLTTAELQPLDYKIALTRPPNLKGENTYGNVIRETKEYAIGINRREFLIQGDYIASTYGKYAEYGVSLTKALLAERKAERDNENKRMHRKNG